LSDLQLEIRHFDVSDFDKKIRGTVNVHTMYLQSFIQTLIDVDINNRLTLPILHKPPFQLFKGSEWSTPVCAVPISRSGLSK
jgi:hypothetical protein